MKTSAILLSAPRPRPRRRRPRSSPSRPVAVLKGAKAGGTVGFEQIVNRARRGLDQDHVRADGLRRQRPAEFHIRASGDLRDGCASTTGHYNPFNKDHGAPADRTRHVGDLGNVVTDAAGNANGNITDRWVQLYGKYSVVGRAVVLHAGTDDLGKTASADSKKTAARRRGRAACGVIGLL